MASVFKSISVVDAGAYKQSDKDAVSGSSRGSSAARKAGGACWQAACPCLATWHTILACTHVVTRTPMRLAGLPSP